MILSQISLYFIFIFSLPLCCDNFETFEVKWIGSNELYDRTSGSHLEFLLKITESIYNS